MLQTISHQLLWTFSKKTLTEAAGGLSSNPHSSISRANDVLKLQSSCLYFLSWYHQALAHVYPWMHR